MVIGFFPLSKLVFLAVRQVSRPVANAIRDHAKDHTIFRKYICMPPAQLYNWLEVKLKMWSLRLGRPISVPPLTESMAVELGANLLGEFVIFASAAGLMILEYARQLAKETKKQALAKREKEEFNKKLAAITCHLECLDDQVRTISKKVGIVDASEKAEEPKMDKKIRKFAVNTTNFIRL